MLPCAGPPNNPANPRVSSGRSSVSRPARFFQEPPARSAYDSQELKDIAAPHQGPKFEEFNVHGSVTQINPGPVVTTFEYKA